MYVINKNTLAIDRALESLEEVDLSKATPAIEVTTNIDGLYIKVTLVNEVVYIKLNNQQVSYKLENIEDVEFVEDYLDKRYLRQCHYSKTVGEFAEEHNKGKFLITMQGHISCIIDGNILDTFDCSDRRMWCAWRVSKP